MYMVQKEYKDDERQLEYLEHIFSDIPDAWNFLKD